MEEELPDLVTENDCDRANVMMRAGYMRSLADRLTGDDRLFCLRAYRSLLVFGIQPPKPDDDIVLQVAQRASQFAKR